MPSSVAGRHEARWWPLLALLLVLLICAAHGIRTVAGLPYPPDIDHLRDVGVIQGLLDGNWLGDPTYEGEWRWYPPLIPALGALGVELTGTLPATFWVQAGPWLNLLGPAAFFLMAAVLFDRPTAALATLAYVFLGSRTLYPWNLGGYTPWPYTGNISEALFFLSVVAIAVRAPSRRPGDAVLIGALNGLTFLAHPVPAILLSAIVAAVAFAAPGPLGRKAAWLALVAVVEIAFSLPYLGPILLHYPNGVAHPDPTTWTDELFLPSREALVRMADLNVPGLLALAAAWLLRHRSPIRARASLILAAWIGMCLLFLGRHYACSLEAAALPDGVCRAMTQPIHHYHMYLQAAWACLIGHALWALARQWLAAGPDRRDRAVIATGALLLAVAVGSQAMMARSFDRTSIEQMEAGVPFDLDLYRWLLGHTRPDTLVLAADDRGAFTAMAAGRRLVAAPIYHANPYVAWQPREARRSAWLAELAPGATPGPELCAAAASGRMLVAAPPGQPLDPAKARPVHESGAILLYELQPSLCGE